MPYNKHGGKNIREDIGSEKWLWKIVRMSIGKFDVSNEKLTLIKKELKKMVYDEYDWLIQLCDCLADVEGILDIEERMRDVRKRYGFYPQDKWDSNLRLMHYFEKKMNRDIYLVCEKETFARVEI